MMHSSMASLGRTSRAAAAAVLSIAALVSSAAANGVVLDEKRGVMTMAPVIEKATPAVVNISVATRRLAGENHSLPSEPYMRRFFGLPDRLPPREAMTAGSGVIVDAAKGYVITNHHVVGNAERITVTIKDGRQLEAKLVDSDSSADVALLKIEANALTDLPLGDSDTLKVGDLVVAIGNPYGLGQSVTSGIVSAVGRLALNAGKPDGLIQTDAPINPGNSGGALINTKGELIGINTAILAPGPGNVGIGFAMPSNTVRAAVEQLLKQGEVRRGRTGVHVRTVTPEVAAGLGLPGTRGVLVARVDRGSPAEQAGVQVGDLITSIDGQAVQDANEVRDLIGRRAPGEKVVVLVVRNGETRTITITLADARAAADEGEPRTRA
jgi:serine protease DegQ